MPQSIGKGFFDAGAIADAEENLLRDYARSRNLEILTIKEFREAIHQQRRAVWHATIVGFNLPFDISRIALDHGSAKRDVRSSFLKLQIEYGSSNPKAAMIDFSKPGREQDTPRGMRKRRQKL
ncbi:MAG: hypothetical protein U5K38_12900 [Woeseiaceae bacterium]|nr:hypothetical protein [Woeseiaceae bacterium]